MNKIIAVIILLITVISITAAIVLSPEIETAENHNNTQNDMNTEEAYLEFKKYINSTKELKQDTEYYINTVRPDIVVTFDVLNENTDELFNIILDNKTVNIDVVLNTIKNGEKELSEKINKALEKFITDDYKNSLMALNKYMNMQNDMIYKIADIYKTDKEMSYERINHLLHSAQQEMSQQEINYLNFLSGVDFYADKEK